MLLTLSFVQLADVKEVFALLKRTAREGDFKPILIYSDKMYVRGVPVRGGYKIVDIFRIKIICTNVKYFSDILKKNYLPRQNL